jgi:hypothetical protein
LRLRQQPRPGALARRLAARHVLGNYVISDRPMTEGEWTRERATVIDVTPEK